MVLEIESFGISDRTCWLFDLVTEKTQKLETSKNDFPVKLQETLLTQVWDPFGKVIPKSGFVQIYLMFSWNINVLCVGIYGLGIPLS